MGRLMRFRRGTTPYRKFGSESNLLVTSNDNKSEQIYNCSQCGHEGTIKPDAENRLNNSGMSQHQTSLPIRMDVVNDLHSSNSDVITKKSDLLLLRKSLGSLITTSLSCVTSNKPTLNRKFLLLEEDCDVIVTSGNDPVKSAVMDNQSWAKITRREEVKLREASWYQPGLSREIATEILSSQSVGAFMVRCSNTSNDSYALSVKIPRVTCGTTVVAHYLILASLSHGYRLKGSAKTFPTLGSLIVHHSVMQEILPCTLNLKTFGSCSVSASPLPGSEDGQSDAENSQELADINEECPELIFTLRKALSSSC